MATPMWNQRNLTSPPIVHLPVSFTLSENVTLQKYQAILTDMKAEFRLLNVMQKEAWIFHRILSKCEESEKNMKWFRECKAILNCFDRLHKMKIEDITAAMQPQTDNDNFSGSNRWPSCQMLEYFLARLIGFAALCQYIWSKGYKTNKLLLQNIEKNILFFRHFSKFGCISRMQILSEHLLEKSCRWYTVLYPWLQCLPKLEADWLPEGATLPNSVEEALGDKLVELRNIASQRGSKKENVKKSILDKIFGMRDSEDMLPQLVLKDDVVSKSSGMKKEAESMKSVEMSLDDIFNGLVDLSVKKSSTLSMVKQKGEGKSKTLEDNDQITPTIVSKDGELSTKNNGQNREDKLKETQTSYFKSEVDVNQSQDLGVPISREEHQEQTKRKKKKKELKRKRNEDDVFGDSDVHKRMKEQPIQKEETFMQDHLLKGENGGLKGDKALELVSNSHGELLTDDPRVEDEQTQPANIAKKKKKKRKNQLSSNISKQELFDEWLMMSETLSGSNAPTDDSHRAKKTLKRSKVGTEQATDECDSLKNLGIRTSPLDSNKVRKRQKDELGYDGIGLNSPGMEKSLEVPLGSEAGTTPVVDSGVISKKRKKKHWKNIDIGEEERLSFHSQQESEKTLIEHEMQSAITVKEETAAQMKKKTKKKKKKNVNHSSLYDENQRASLEVKRQTDIAGPSGGAEQAGSNNNGLGSADEMNALVLKSNVTNGNKKKRKKKKKKRFLTDI